ncbi:DnaJ-domain-containing protein, partial [Sistotremastrum suecicum HHB10207 ss-3]
RKRKIGTQERPLETAYYDILEIPINASEEEIKKAYRRLAIKYHPDKNRDDPNAEEKFKSLSIAYQTLSSPPLRRKYNEFGSSSSSSPDSSSYIDPEEVFGAIFGGERFVGIIGEIGLARDMKSALQEGEEDEQVKDDGGGRARDKKGRIILTPEEKAKKDAKERQAAEEKAKIREERVRKLIVELERKLSIYTESATGDPVLDKELGESWRQICLLEAEDLKNESYGLELLHTIGFVYDSKARHWMESQRYFGVGGWVHNVQGKYHVFSETVSTLRSAMDLKAVFDQIAAAEKNGTLSDSERKKLEEQAAEKGLLALFK